VSFIETIGRTHTWRRAVPTYAYACRDCGHDFEAVQSFSDDSLTVCPECGGNLRKVFANVGVVFKGSGFYRNDSRGPDKSAGDKSDKGSSDKGSSDKGSSDQPSSDKGSDKGSDKKAAAKDSGGSGDKKSAPVKSGSTSSGSGSAA
jgi:putative FmdB family regulatory protein